MQYYVIPQFAVVELDENGKMVWKATFLHSYEAERFVAYLREQNEGETIDINCLPMKVDRERAAASKKKSDDYKKGIADGTIKPRTVMEGRML